MAPLKCRQCGVDLVPETSFCRQCGTRVTADLPLGSDPTTKLISEEDLIATQRLDPRPTAGDPARLDLPSHVIPAEQKKSGSKVVLIAAVLIILLAGLVTTVAIVRSRLNRDLVSGETMIYPGARKTMDIVSEGGGRALQLETSDSLEQVDDWYRDALKPNKVIRLSASSVVLKNDKSVATIVREGNQTNILIKTTP